MFVNDYILKIAIKREQAHDRYKHLQQTQAEPIAILNALDALMFIDGVYHDAINNLSIEESRELFASFQSIR